MVFTDVFTKFHQSKRESEVKELNSNSYVKLVPDCPFYFEMPTSRNQMRVKWKIIFIERAN